jgi:hypothetical protein|tara:strand:+ start:2479 stop:2661 length:183 start_codon:yes stop_codon:yes gene_type:complete
MKLIMDKRDPDLYAEDVSEAEMVSLQATIKTLNVDLMDDNFEQYQFYVESIGNKVFIRRK